MKTNSKTNKQLGIEEYLNEKDVEKIAKESGFCKREPRKIKPIEFLMGFFMMHLNNGYSYSSWAEKVGILCKNNISKQAINKKIKKELMIFLKILLEKNIGSKMNINLKNKTKEIFKNFQRVLVNDSTTIKLNNKLANHFPGNGTGDKNIKYALLKIQTAYNVKDENFLNFEITNFRKNDQSASGDIINIAKAGDLIIRDLGYFSTKVFKEMGIKKIFFFKPYEI